MSDVFTPGGPVPPDSPCYILRESDEEALYDIWLGRFITILGARQMGKTSLLCKLQHDLRKRAARAALVDLSQFANLQPGAWYRAVFAAILTDWGVLPNTIPLPADQLGIQLFLTQVAETDQRSRFFILLDEVASVSRENADAFFSALRSIYARKIGESQDLLSKFSFAFAGSFYPDELISNPLISPFNISQEIHMRDFTEQETYRLVACLQMAGIAGPVDSIAARIYRYTSGQPYLVQQLCSILAMWHLNDRKNPAEWVDRAVTRLYQGDSNLVHVVKHISRDPKLAQTCWMILEGKRIRFDRIADKSVRHLELIGAVKESPGGYCIIKNRLYERILEHSLGLAGQDEYSRQHMARVYQQQEILGQVEEIEGVLSGNLDRQVSPPSNSPGPVRLEQAASLKRQLTKHKRNLLIIEERKADYVDPRSVPPDLLESERLVREKIAEIEARLTELEL